MSASGTTSTAFDLEIFFDGDCPICVREKTFLTRFDRRRRIRFTDIAAADFDVADLGVPMSKLMARIHGRLPDGTLVEGVDVFLRAYRAIGLGALVALSAIPGVRPVLDYAYERFAANRLRLTGRCTPQTCAD